MLFTEEWADKRKRHPYAGNNSPKDEHGFVDMKSFPAEKKVEFIEQFRTLYNISRILKKLDIRKEKFFDHVAIDKKFRRAVNEVDEEWVDRVEEVLVTNALDPNAKSSDRVAFLNRKRYSNTKKAVKKAEKKLENEKLHSLAEKMKKYQLIPKEKVIEADVERTGSN